MKISKSILRFLVDTLFGQETYDEDPYLIKYRNSIDQTKYFKVRYLILFFIVPFAALAQSPIQFVDPLIGTAPATTESARKHSEAGSELKGQTFPGVGRPFGMTQWTPETRTTEDKCISPYYYNDQFITGFRGSHWMSGSCTQDYGSVTIMPFTTNQIDTLKSSPVSRFSHQNETATPAYYRVMLESFDIQAELTGSVRSGMMRFLFSGEGKNYLQIRANSDEKVGKIWIDRELNELVGYNPAHRIYQGQGKSAGFSGFFVIRFDQTFEILPQTTNSQQIVLSFGKEKTVQTQIGTSFTSIDAARKNLDQEISGWNFEQLRKLAEDEWNRTLGKVEVEGDSKDDKIKFYTALYHCFQLPRVASDVDGSYQGFAQDTSIHKAVDFTYYDDFSMWDTYRCLHPLLTILEPKRSLDMVKSLVAKAEQGDWMPIFPAWGNYTAAMIGDHVSTMISDAFAKGITGFDTEKAYMYMRKNAFENPTQAEYLDGKGRRALKSYIKYGYIPLEDSVWQAFHKREQVSRTLEYAFDDFALAQFAKSLGKTVDYSMLMKRSQNYRNVFDTNTNFVRGRYADGRWIESFDPFAKASFITEGTPSQYTWYVPQDIPGLMKVMGGKDAFLKHLNTFFDGGYYWHGNETDQQAAYLFAVAGDPKKTQEWVRKIVTEEYGAGPGGLSGNEDAGQMSAWLVSSMMGFYPVCPATDQYVMGIPLFKKIIINLENGQKIILNAPENSLAKPYVQSVKWNGESYTNSWFSHHQLMKGAVIDFTMGSE
ncbi:MAG TPA: GH92 family glycosyl hydrolase [Prolixibacteraceae bacterium]|nr:GH92 family glycosyl hydrolase [Prolixibacteraceae bacterium]